MVELIELFEGGEGRRRTQGERSWFLRAEGVAAPKFVDVESPGESC